jgi:hypothetical protein
VAEQAKPRKIAVQSHGDERSINTNPEQHSINATSGDKDPANA